MKKILILLCTAGLAMAGREADTLKEQQTAWKNSVSAEKSGDYDTAISSVKEYVGKRGDKYNAAVRLGWLCYTKKDYAEAVKYYQMAAKYSQGAVTPLLGLMNTYKASKQSREAAKACRAVLVLDKTNYTASMTLAGLLYEEKRYGSAGLVYAKVNKLYPEDLDSMSGLAWCMVYEGKKSRALPLFTRLVVMSPDYAYARQGYELCGGEK